MARFQAGDLEKFQALYVYGENKLSLDAQLLRWGKENNWIFFFIVLDFPCLVQIWKIGMVRDVPMEMG